MRGRDGPWDAVILGGGPAGSVAALRLARGRRVLILERKRGSETRVGESLPPASRPLLRDLGLLDRMDGHRPYLGNRTLWGGSVATHDFLRDPQGAGWHLDRAAFDGMLLAAAQEAGTTLRQGDTVQHVARTGETWELTTQGGARLVARLLIDATGRAAAVSRRVGARRHVLDRLTGVYAVLRTSAGGPQDGFSRIEADGEGWWYSAPLPGDRRIAAFHSDSDRPILRELATSEGFLAALRRTRLIAVETPVTEASMVTGPQTVAAHSAVTAPSAGDGWLALGDAALALDPLSSQGLMNALFTGMTGGDTAAALLDGDDSALAAYSHRLARIESAYTKNLAHFYAAEAYRRNGFFWSRRTGGCVAAQVG